MLPGLFVGGTELAVERLIIARRVELLLLSVIIGRRCLIVISRGGSERGCVAAQRMHRARIVLCWGFRLLVGALHPWRQARGGLVMFRFELLILLALDAARLDPRI